MPSTTKGLPWRSGVSGLSEDALLVLDAMFRYGHSVRTLGQARYAIHENTNYTHSLDDEALSGLLEEFVRRGVLRAEQLKRGTQADGTYFSFTPVGGALWESERQPIWDAYCTSYTASEERHEDGTRITHLEAFTVAAIHACLGHMEREPIGARLIEPKENAVFTEGRQRPLISWKPQTPVIEATIKTRSGLFVRRAFGPSERQRSWACLKTLDRVRFERE